MAEYAGTSVSAYAFMMAIGATLLFLHAGQASATFSLPRRQILWLLMLAWVAGWIGARVFFVVEHRQLLPDPWWGSILSPAFGGFASYGGVLGGIGSAALFSRWAGMPALRVLDAGSIGLCMFGVAARVGCFLAGCCHGSPSAMGVVFPPGSPAAQRFGADVAVHATQLYEAAALAAIAAVWTSRTNASSPPGLRFLAVMMSYGVARFLLEGFRGDSAIAQGLFSSAQWVSLFLIALAASMLVIARRYLWIEQPVASLH